MSAAVEILSGERGIMDVNTVRVGLIGAGANTRRRHIPGFRAIEGVEIVGVANRTRESGQRVADEYEIPTVYDSWIDLIESPDIDAICIGTWPNTHCAMVLAALDNDKHVLTEARMAMDADEARAMLAASRERPHLVVQVVPAPYTLGVDGAIKRLIGDGFLGDILSVDVSMRQGGFIDRDAPWHWRHDRDLSGYNILRMGIWYEILMRWIGPASSVVALTRVSVPIRKDESGARRFVTVPDHAEILCEMASGPVVNMGHSAVSGLAPADEVWLFGTDGTLRLDALTMRLYGGRRGDDKLSEIQVRPEEQGRWRVEEEFISAVRGLERVTHTTFEDGVRYMEFTEAVTRSAQTGQKIALPL